MNNRKSLNNLPIRINCLQVFIFTLIACSLFSFISPAQLYTRTTFNAAFAPITTGGGAIVSTATGNDVNQTAIPLGFTLNYAGINYTTVGLNTNGLLFFDAVAPSAAEGASFNNMFVSGGGGTDKSISAWWADMIDDASSDILYQTQGTAGSQTFTVQYTNYPHWRSTGGTNVRLNFQVIFYEGTNVIEFNYGSRAVTGPPTVSGGACIGIEYGTGGAGNFIDLVTGSGQTSHGMLSPLIAWPSYNYRLTPGAPTPVAAGTYNVGIGQTYPSLTLATSDLNHRGISGPVILNLTDNNYDTTVANGSHIFPVFVGPFKGSSPVNTVTISKTGTPATFSYRGSPVVQGGFGCGSTGGLSAFSDSEEPIMGVSAKYTTISNINLVSLGTTANDVEIGLMVFESFGGDSGAQHNVFDRISVNMDRNNSSTIGIFSNNMTNPGGLQGSNSFNTYRDITIRDCYAGIHLEGAGGVYEPDAGNQIISSSCTTFNSIGDPAVPNDIGGGSATYGIWLGAQNGFTLRNTIIRNITTTSSASAIDGILVSSCKGICEISNNSIRTIKRNNTAAGGTYILTGIRLSHSNSVNEFRIFNNSISELSTNYTGVATASRAVRGIYFDDTGAGTNTFNIWNNSISIDGSTFPNASNACIQFLDGGAFTVNMKNNVLANFTSAQTGVANHYCIVTSAADRYGLINSLSDYNDLYIANDQGISGHIGLGASSNYSTLANWQAGMSFNAGTDANSVSVNPNFVNNNSDLHATSLSTSLDETGTAIPAYITADIDCETRVAPHDIGSDDFTVNQAPAFANGANTNISVCQGSLNSALNSLLAVTDPDNGQTLTWSVITSPTKGTANGFPANASSTGGSVTPSGLSYSNNGTTGSDLIVVQVSDGQATAQINVNIAVNSNPAPAITGSTGFCSGSSTTLDAGSGYSLYNWSTGATTQTINVNTATTVTVTVTDGNGCTGSDSETTTVNANPAPSITGSTSFCTGGSTTLDAGSGYSLYNWSTGATTQTINVNTATTVTVTVTDGNGCTGSDSETTTVGAGLTPTITGSTGFCSGSSITLDAGPGYSLYNWSTGATTQTINVNTATTVTVTVTDGNGCTGSDSETTTVNTNPAPSITGNTGFCTGSSTTLDAGPGYSLYNWSTGATTQTINVNTAGTFSVTVTNGSGCTGSTSAAATVNPLPTVSYTGLAAAYNVGAAAATLTGSPAGGTFSGPGISGNTFTPSAAGVGGPYTIVYSFTDGNGCTNTASHQTTVTGCAPPGQPGTITLISGTAKVCPISTCTYKVSALSGATSFTWTPPAGGTITLGQGSGQITINYTAGFTASGTLSVVANNACGSGIPRTLTITRNNPAIPALITGAGFGVCNGTGVPYSVTNVAGITYNWSFNAGAASVAGGQGSNAITADYTPAFVSGTLSVTAGNACGISASRNMSISAKPAAPASITGSTLVCANQFGVPYSIAPIASATTYTWTGMTGSHISDGIVTSSGVSLTTASTNVTVNFGATTGKLNVRGNNSCGTGLNATLTIGFNCREEETGFNVQGSIFNVYPNPAHDIITVSIDVKQASVLTAQLADITGRVVLSENESAMQGLNTWQLGLNHLSKGVYMLDVKSGSESWKMKVVVE